MTTPKTWKACTYVTFMHVYYNQVNASRHDESHLWDPAALIVISLLINVISRVEFSLT